MNSPLKHRLTGLSSALALTAALAAQDAESPLRLAPKDALLVAQFDAPSRWVDRFAETRLGQFLAGPAGEEVVAALPEELQAMFDRADSEAPPEVHDFLDALQQSSGRFSVAVELDIVDMMQEPAVRGLIALTPGPNDDLDRLGELAAAAFDTVVRDSDQPVVEQPFGDLTLSAIGDDMWVSAPQQVGDDLIVLFWSGEQDAIESWAKLDAADRFAPDTELDGSLEMRWKLGPMVKLIVDMAEQEVPFPLRAIFERLGLLALDRFDLSIRPQDEFVVSDFELRWEGDGGLLEALVPAADGRLDLLEITPWHMAACSDTTYQFGKFYDVVMGLADDLEGIVDVSREQIAASFEEQFKVRLREDLIDHLGDEVLNAGDEQYMSGDPADPLFGVAGLAYAIELNDAAAFGKSFETMLRSQGMHAARKTTRYGDFDLHRIKLLGMFDLDYALTDRLIVLSVGAEDPAALRSILDEEARRRAGEPPADMPEAITERRAHAPAKLTSLGAMSMERMLRLMELGMRSSAAGTPEAEDIAEFLDALTPTIARLREAGLDRLVTTMDAEPGHLRARMIW